MKGMSAPSTLQTFIHSSKELVSSIGKGVLVFAAVAPGDTEKEADSLASKVLKMKLWDDEAGGRWKKSVQDINGEVLCVSQFTLLAKTTKGSKPDFHGAMGGEEASRLYHYFLKKVQDGYIADRVKNGKFQAMMEVALVNDGPVTLELSVAPKPPPTSSGKTSSISTPKPQTPEPSTQTGNERAG